MHMNRNSTFVVSHGWRRRRTHADDDVDLDTVGLHHGRGDLNKTLTDCACVVGLNGKDTSGGCEVFLVGDESRSTL